MTALFLSLKRSFFTLLVLSLMICACGDPLPSLPLDASPSTEPDAQVMDEGNAGEEISDSGPVEQDAEPTSTDDAFCQNCSDEVACPDGFTCFNHESNGEQFCSKTCENDRDCPNDYSCSELNTSEAQAGDEAGDETTETEVRPSQSYCIPNEGQCSPSLCRDEDGDGYGRGPDCEGLDCADDNPDIHEGVTDLCDNVDNDCDGFFDEDFVSEACGQGICAGISLCETGRVNCNGPEAQGEDANCNGVDEDCDGSVDEGYQSINCGLGSCAQPSTCVNGAEQCEGLPAPVNDTDQACDRVDSDCDGQIDEGFLLNSSGCGLGVCFARASCGDQGEICTPNPQLGDDSNCNGEDDDCDGAIDEGFASTISCGQGACFRQTSCVAGATMCTAGIPLAMVDDSCNSIDDDCNGIIDDRCPDNLKQMNFSLVENTATEIEIAITFSGTPNEPDPNTMPSLIGAHFSFPNSLTILSTSPGQALIDTYTVSGLSTNNISLNNLSAGAGLAHYMIPGIPPPIGIEYVQAGELLRIRFTKTQPQTTTYSFTWVTTGINAASASNTAAGILEVIFTDAVLGEQ